MNYFKWHNQVSINITDHSKEMSMEGLQDVLDCIKVNDAIHYKKLQFF